MNNSIKALIGLVTTGTAVAGAFLANNLLNKGEEKSKIDTESSEVDSEALAIQWEKRNASRVSTLTQLFKGADESKRRKMSYIISGIENNPVFYINTANNRFYNDGDVATSVNGWCNSQREDEQEKLRELPELRKTEICAL